VDFILVFWGLCWVTEIVVRELIRAKPDAWGCVQTREEWSTEEESQRRPGHFWICKFGTFPGVVASDC
jgi:hypothetical protein